MISDQDKKTAMDVTTYIGLVAANLMKYEKEIAEATELAKIRLEENPESVVMPMVTNLLRSATDLIAAHKLIDKYGSMMMSGSVFIDGSETVH